MTTRAVRRNETGNDDIEYQVFGVFKSHDLDAAADCGDFDHRWMTVDEMYAALKNRALIDTSVQDFFACLPTAHTSVMNRVVG